MTRIESTSSEPAHDVIVVGAGISGIAFAWKAAQEGRRVLLLEQEARAGGCLHSHRTSDGFWFELGAHTAYNSYGSFLDLAAGSGAAKVLVQRGPARVHFGLLRDGAYRWLTPPRVLLELSWIEVALNAPFGLLRTKRGETMRSYYSRLIGRRNYDRILGPFLSAVPSQSADGFPAEGPGSLFKKRPRRKEFVRSYGFDGGLQTVCDAAARSGGIELRTGVRVLRVAPRGEGFAVTTSEGRGLEARLAALAVPAHQAALMLQADFPAIAAPIGRVKPVSVESAGVVLPRERCWLPECAFVVPVDDLFFSCVTRDPFPDPARRAFAFHFKPGVPREEKTRRMSEVLRVPEEEMGDVVETTHHLPAPALGHDVTVREIDRALAGLRLAVTGNYFAGLAIEDCVLRSNSEWARVTAA